MKYTALLLVLFTPLTAADRIAVIAHRGEHRAHPENTLPAFQAAIDAGADFFELDVRTTSDGGLVLMHDRKVDRTTNGTGAVREMTFDQIRALDAGAKFSPQFAGTKVPSLEEALARAPGKVGLFGDSKGIPPRRSGCRAHEGGHADPGRDLWRHRIPEESAGAEPVVEGHAGSRQRRHSWKAARGLESAGGGLRRRRFHRRCDCGGEARGLGY